MFDLKPTGQARRFLKGRLQRHGRVYASRQQPERNVGAVPTGWMGYPSHEVCDISEAGRKLIVAVGSAKRLSQMLEAHVNRIHAV